MSPGQAQFPLWGGMAEVWCDDGDQLTTAVAVVDRVTGAVDRGCSTFRADSDLSRVNAASGDPVVVGATLRAVLRDAMRCAAATGGLTDPTVGRATTQRPTDPPVLDPRTGAGLPQPRPRTAGDWRDVEVDDARGTVRVGRGLVLDLNATAKAWAADRAAHAAARATGSPVLVNLCGDLAVAGPPTTDPWLVLVDDDHRPTPGDVCIPAGRGARVHVRTGGVATSSTVVRRRPSSDGSGTVAHVVDPRSWIPVAGPWRTATVAAGSCVDANAAATAALVLGGEAPAWLAQGGLPARLVAEDGTVELIGGWPE